MSTTEVVCALNDEDFERMRADIGKDLRLEQFTWEANRETIKRYAYGLGDDNPLWTDEAYARASRFGGIVAPPTFAFAVFDAEVGRGLPIGVQPIHVASDVTVDRLVREGERVEARAKLLDVRDVVGKRAGRMAVQTSESTFWVGDERVTRVVQTIIGMVRDRGAGDGTYAPRPRQRYTPEELDRIDEEILAQERRGDAPRYWEDVSEGDQLALTKPPLDQMAMTCYYAGSLGGANVYKTGRVRAKFRELVRSGSDLAPTTLDEWVLLDRDISTGHQDSDLAREYGMPGAYDNGNQRTGFCAEMVTDWMGDAADLKQVGCSIKAPRVYGDLLRLTGTVSRKAIDDDGSHVVGIDIVGTNQYGEETTGGSAVVKLPTR